MTNATAPLSHTGAPLTAADAARELAALRRTRGSRKVRSACVRCGGKGGDSSWPDFICFRCHGVNSHIREVETERFYTNADSAARDAELVAFVDAVAAAARAVEVAQREAAAREAAHAEALVEDVVRAQRSEVPFLAEVGKRVNFAGEVRVGRSVTGAYGRSFLIILRDAATGATVKMFAVQGDVPMEENGVVCATVAGKATVTAHETRDGERVTVVSRVKFDYNIYED
jgi:hypothetical protein